MGLVATLPNHIPACRTELLTKEKTLSQFISLQIDKSPGKILFVKIWKGFSDEWVSQEANHDWQLSDWLTKPNFEMLNTTKNKTLRNPSKLSTNFSTPLPYTACQEVPVTKRGMFFVKFLGQVQNLSYFCLTTATRTRTKTWTITRTITRTPPKYTRRRVTTGLEFCT